MKITDASGGCRPTELQEKLLKACLLKDDRAVTAWREWHAADGLERLDQGSYRLLALLYQNLKGLGVKDPALGTLRGIHRRFWCETKLLFAKMNPVLQQIEDAGIPTLLMKGAPLALLYYADVGQRPMQDLDILVPEDRAWETIQLLHAVGWENDTTGGFNFSKRDLNFRHSLSLRDPSGLEFDLHWHSLYLACYRGADRQFWEASQPMEFDGIPTRTLCATDHLIQACAHGLIWSDIPTIRWASDAVAIMRAGSIDWARVIEVSRELRLILPTREGLRYLKRTLDAPVPEEVIESLERLQATRAEQLEYQRLQDAEAELSVPDTVRGVYARYLRGARGQSLRSKILNFPRFLQFYWKLESPLQVYSNALRWSLWRLGLRSSPDDQPA
jgi:putative nucleotidyltransferase-like protein